MDLLSNNFFNQKIEKSYLNLGSRKYIENLYGYWIDQRIGTQTKFNFLYSEAILGKIRAKGLKALSAHYFKKNISELTDGELIELVKKIK